MRRLLWLVLLLVGCGGSPTPAPAPPKPRAKPRPAATQELRDAGWGQVISLRLLLEFALPERASWHVDDGTSPWLVATHEDTDSVLMLRTWRGARLTSTADCEKQARLWRPELPAAPAEEVLEVRRMGVPEGFDVQLVVGVRPGADLSEIEGYALAFGAQVGRCYTASLSTRARGPNAEETIGKRLGFLVDGVLAAVHARSIEDRSH